MKSSKYVWKVKYGTAGLSAEEAGRHLAKLRKRKGRLTPRIVLDDARSPRSPLHKCFEWDDAKAAERHRLEQAGEIIRHLALVVTVGKTEKTIRAYVNISRGSGNYENVLTVLGSRQKTRRLLDQALQDLEQWQERYSTLAELSDAAGYVNRAIAAIKRKPSRRRAA